MTKYNHIAGVVLISLFFCFVVWPFYAQGSSDIVVEGFCLEKFSGMERVYSLEAGNAYFSNKRIGFFSTAFIKVIQMHNVCLTFYKDGNIIKTQRVNDAVYEINSKCLFDEKGVLLFSESDFDKIKNRDD